MTVKEKLLKEFEAAIYANYGDRAEEEYEEGNVTSDHILYIANKVKFYMDLR